MKNTETPMTAVNDMAVYTQRLQVMRWRESTSCESSWSVGQSQQHIRVEGRGLRVKGRYVSLRDTL
jgi:hypothetical protein